MLGFKSESAWLIQAFAALLSWGVWGHLGAVAERRVHPVGVFELHALGYLLAASAIALASGSTLLPGTDQLALSSSAGAGYGSGMLAMIAAIRSGYPAGLAVVLTSMYPLGTFALNLLVRGEGMSGVHALGVLLGLVAIVLLVEPWKGRGEEHANTWGFTLCMLSLAGYTSWTFLLEDVDPSKVGVSTLWQALGCLAVCVPGRLLRRCTSHTPGAAADGSRGESDSLLPGPRAPDSSDWVEVKGGILAAFGMGLAMALGACFFMLSCDSAPELAPVVMITSMYTIVTVILNRIFLGEELGLLFGAGALCALGACILLAME